MRHVEERIDEMAARQHGMLSRAQALEAGLSPRQVEYRLARGLWFRVRRGVYRMAGAPRSWQGELLAACLATGGVASHQSAAALFGLAPPPARPHVTVRRTASARAPGAVVHRSAVEPRDTCRVGEIPCTRPARTLVDCAATLPFTALCEALDGALCARLTDEDTIRRTAQRAGRAPGRRGGAALRRALAVWTPGPLPGSVAEVRLLRRVAASGLPPPQRQFVVRDPSGRFVARVDLAWPACRVALEYDGRRWHGPRRSAHDTARHDRLAALGWRVRRVGRGARPDRVEGSDEGWAALTGELECLLAPLAGATRVA